MKLILALALSVALSGCALFSASPVRHAGCDPVQPSYRTGAIPQHSSCRDDQGDKGQRQRESRPRESYVN